jgi:SAM-dependent methyltransferase
MAVPLTEYLSSKGEYQGFDIVKNGIEWCQKKISSRYPNFHFRQVDIRNDLYRSAGSNAAGFRFPYDKEYFDFAFLTSVFTHMLPEEVENYLSEIFRVLKPGGRCLCTFFILESGEKTNNPAFLFPFDYGHYHTMSEDSRSANVAYSMEYLKEQLEVRRSFSIQQIHKGYWKSGRQKEELEFQDILIIRKEEVS